MATPYLLKALDLNSLTFQKLNKTPVEWDKSMQKLIYISANKRQLWCFNTTFFVFIFGFLVTVMSMLKQLYFPDEDFYSSHLLIHIFGSTGALYGTGVNLVIHLYGEDYVRGLNQLVNYHNKIMGNRIVHKKGKDVTQVIDEGRIKSEIYLLLFTSI